MNSGGGEVRGSDLQADTRAALRQGLARGLGEG